MLIDTSQVTLYTGLYKWHSNGEFDNTTVTTVTMAVMAKILKYYHGYSNTVGMQKNSR